MLNAYDPSEAVTTCCASVSVAGLNTRSPLSRKRSIVTPPIGRSAPGEKPDYVSLEGYLAAQLLAEGLRRAGPKLDTERLVTALEGIHDFEMGLGASINFGLVEHQGSHKVWGTRLNGAGKYEALDLE